MKTKWLGFLLLVLVGAQVVSAQCSEKTPPVIFVHGGAGSGAQFESQAMRFTSNGYPADCLMVFEYDSSAYSVSPTYQAQTLALLSQKVNETFESIGKPVLIGHSLGTRVVYNYTLFYSDYEDKVAKIILVDGIANVPAPNVPTLAIFGRPTALRPPGANVTGATNVYIQNQTHVEVMTSAESFVEMFKFITGKEPVTKYILPEKEIELKGKLVYFPSNIGLETGTLNIYELREDGFRLSNTPVATYTITDGTWGPFNAKPGVRYEFEFVRANNLTMHFYREPFLRSDYWIRFLVSPPGGIAEYASRSDQHTNLLIMRYKEILTEVDPLYVKTADDLKINGVSVCDPRICNVTKALNGPTGIWIFDNNSDQQSVLYPPNATYHAQAFQTGIDYYIPAGAPDQSINVTIFARGGGVQTLKVPNWKSSEHRVILQFNDYVQTFSLLSPYGIPAVDAEILVPYYADPFAVNISSMPKFEDLSGSGWIKVDLPEPCKTGNGNQSFIMVKKGSGANASKLLFYLEGGGACVDFLTCRPLLEGTVVKLDLNFPELVADYKMGIFNFSNPLNPFRDWTVVFVPFSTGDFHHGNRVVKYYNITNPSNPTENKTIYHVGYVNAIVAMRWINQTTFDRVVLAGSSAGGFGSILHHYKAYEIFKKPITVINDAGPGIRVSETNPFNWAVTTARWGSLQNFPAESVSYFNDKDLLHFLDYSLPRCEGCIYGLYEDQYDFVIGTLRADPTDFRAQLVSLSNEIKMAHKDKFFRFFVLDLMHMVLPSCYGFPQCYAVDRFYNLNISGYYFYQWVNALLAGSGKDIVQENWIGPVEKTVRGTELKRSVWTVDRPPYGSYDKIAIERVVNESIGGDKPVILILPGTWSSGEQLANLSWNDNGWIDVNEEYALVPFLANRGFDVYTIDYRTHFVPNNTTDFSFMFEWGWVNWIWDIKTAVEKIKQISGKEKIYLAGESFGGSAAQNYATLFQEDLKGLILLDGMARVGTRTNSYNLTANLTAMKAGAIQYQVPSNGGPNNWHIWVDAIVNPSPIKNITLLSGLSTWYVFPGAANPFSYPWAILIPHVYFAVMAAFDPFWSNRLNLDRSAYADWQNCPYLPFDFDDHYSEITVPVISFVSQWGYNLGLLVPGFGGPCVNPTGSDDFTCVLLQGYGHLDVYNGPFIRKDVNEPLLNWMLGIENGSWDVWRNYDSNGDKKIDDSELIQALNAYDGGSLSMANMTKIMVKWIGS
ncbi:MAG: alpha/beta fold hydrolase [Archaeoglobaceae archaeon]